MKPVGRGESIGAESSALQFFAQASGTMVDPEVLKYQIWDLTTEAKQLAPVQVTAQKDALPNRIGLGRYFADWDCPANEPLGLHEVRWEFQLTPSSPLTVVRQQFEVVPMQCAAGPFYAMLSDMRAEGVTTDDCSDARLLLAIQRSSKLIERYTGRFFEPRYLSLDVDGRGTHTLLLGVPVIGVESLQVALTYLHPNSYSVEAGLYRVYNRHLDGLLQPDDRNDPKIDLYHSGRVESTRRPFSFTQMIFMKGQRNVHLAGVFGYTDADGSPYGQTPELIRRACQLMTLREVPKLADGDAREEVLRRYRILSEKTRDQEYTLAANTLRGAFTGDPEIDQILASYVRPPALGAA